MIGSWSIISRRAQSCRGPYSLSHRTNLDSYAPVARMSVEYMRRDIKLLSHNGIVATGAFRTFTTGWCSEACRGYIHK